MTTTTDKSSTQGKDITEYATARVVVRVHGKVDQRRIEKACLTYLANTTKYQKEK